MNSPRPNVSNSKDQSERLDQAMRAFRAGDLDSAQAACDLILSEDEFLAGAHHLLSEIQLQSGQVEAALQSAKRAVTHAPDNAIYQNGLGMTLLAIGRLDDAEAAFDVAIEQQPQLPEPHTNKATVQLNRNQLQDALETLEEGLRLNPGHEALLANLGVALHRQDIDRD